jgi:hypothetical protein
MEKAELTNKGMVFSGGVGELIFSVLGAVYK